MGKIVPPVTSLDRIAELIEQERQKKDKIFEVQAKEEYKPYVPQRHKSWLLAENEDNRLNEAIWASIQWNWKKKETVVESRRNMSLWKLDILEKLKKMKEEKYGKEVPPGFRTILDWEPVGDRFKPYPDSKEFNEHVYKFLQSLNKNLSPKERELKPFKNIPREYYTPYKHDTVIQKIETRAS